MPIGGGRGIVGVHGQHPEDDFQKDQQEKVDEVVNSQSNNSRNTIVFLKLCESLTFLEAEAHGDPRLFQVYQFFIEKE